VVNGLARRLQVLVGIPKYARFGGYTREGRRALLGRSRRVRVGGTDEE
jgi:hypothetical protein